MFGCLNAGRVTVFSMLVLIFNVPCWRGVRLFDVAVIVVSDCGFAGFLRR